jgi:hypothetical protein
MDITAFYNHASMMQDVSEGKKIISNTAKGNELQLFDVGDTVKPGELCTYNFGTGVVVDFYKKYGYIYYTVSSKVGRKQITNIYRQKDLRK